MSSASSSPHMVPSAAPQQNPPLAAADIQHTNTGFKLGNDMSDQRKNVFIQRGQGAQPFPHIACIKTGMRGEIRFAQGRAKGFTP